MKLSILKYLFIGLMVTAVISCDKNDDSTDRPTFDEFVKSRPELSMFAKAVDKAGLESFKTGPGPFTWFAPTNDAFTAALVTEDSLNKMTSGQVNYLILYHLLNAGLKSGDMVAVNSTPKTTQLGSSAGQMFIANLNGEVYTNGSKVISKDNIIDNGYVHIINRLIVPPILKGSIASVLTSSGQHSLFIRAMTRAGLWTTTTLGTTGSTPVYTVFAPTDAAMTTAGYTSTFIDAATPASLSAIMRYHYILNIRLFTNDLNKPNIPATAAGSASYITPSENGTKVKGKNNSSAVNIIKSDILGTNGVVHVIDGVLRP